MPRYYFDMRDGDGVVPDEEGMELATMKAVQQEAAQTLACMVRDAIGEHPNGPVGAMAIEVRDDGGPVLQVKFQFSIDRRKEKRLSRRAAFATAWSR